MVPRGRQVSGFPARGPQPGGSANKPTTPDLRFAPPRDRYVYHPSTAEIPEGAAINFRNHSFKIAAEVNISNGAQGVLFSHGGRFGCHSLFVKDNKLHYVYNWLGEIEQEIVSDIDVSAGDSVLGMAFERESNDEQFSTLGTASLLVNDQKVGELSIKTQPGKFSLGGEGVNIGKDLGEPISAAAYEPPFPCSGGSIREGIIDVSGEQNVDLELEALGIMKRDNPIGRRRLSPAP